MPIEYRCFLDVDTDAWEFARTRTTWIKNKRNVYLPDEYSSVTFSSPGKERTLYEGRYHWRVGDEFPKGLIDLMSDHWSEGIRKLFDEDWDKSELRFSQIGEIK